MLVTPPGSETSRSARSVRIVGLSKMPIVETFW